MSLSDRARELENSYYCLLRLAGEILATVEVNHLREILVVMKDGERNHDGDADFKGMIERWKEELKRHDITPAVEVRSSKQGIYIATFE